jgi:4-hydroxybenzoate polyprenyltransferase
MHVMPAAVQTALELIKAMLRVRTAFLLLLFITISDVATKSAAEHYSPYLISVVAAVACWYIFSTSINDLADEAIDQINLKGNSERPLANQKTSRFKLWLLAITSAAAALIASLPLGSTGAVISLGALVLSYCYSMPPVRFSYRGIIAPLILPIGYVVYPFCLTMQANNAAWTAPRLQLLSILYVCFIGRIILKDFRDVKGDRQFGKRTFIVRHGAAATCVVSALTWPISLGLLIWRFWGYPLVWLLILPFVAAILLFLKFLSRETNLKRQIQFVGLIGRVSNGMALLVLAALYKELSPANTGLYTLLLFTLALFAANASYVLYRPLLQSGKLLTRARSSAG